MKNRHFVIAEPDSRPETYGVIDEKFLGIDNLIGLRLTWPRFGTTENARFPSHRWRKAVGTSLGAAGVGIALADSRAEPGRTV